MNGVEILSQNTIYETEVCWWIFVVCASLGFVIGLILSIIAWIINGFDTQDIGFIVALTGCFALMGMLLTVPTEHDTDVVDHIEYKVTIDDSVSMNEFLDKYEILDQEGKIYTVKERE
jgi:nucleoside permease NupC